MSHKNSADGIASTPRDRLPILAETTSLRYSRSVTSLNASSGSPTTQGCSSCIDNNRHKNCEDENLAQTKRNDTGIITKSSHLTSRKNNKSLKLQPLERIENDEADFKCKKHSKMTKKLLNRKRRMLTQNHRNSFLSSRSSSSRDSSKFRGESNCQFANAQQTSEKVNTYYSTPDT